VVARGRARSSAWGRLPGISAPLGSLSDVVGLVPPGGLRGNERTELVRFEGCAADQILYVQRFAANAALVGHKLEQWLNANRLPKGWAVSKKDLRTAIEGIRQSVSGHSKSCVRLAYGWKILGVENCTGVSNTIPFEHPKTKRLTALVHVAPPDRAQPERCRPRISAILFDAGGRERLRYHVDFQDQESAELVIDRGRVLEVRFDGRAFRVKGALLP
jgi:hypothetical protein